jgi:hypothetical protein
MEEKKGIKARRKEAKKKKLKIGGVKFSVT